MLTSLPSWNGRGVGITEFLQNHAEWLLLVAFALVTQFGDVWFLFALAGVAYVAGDFAPRLGINRRQGLFVLALALTYVALIGVLKTAFELPRPPGAGDPPAMRWIPAAFRTMFADVTTASGPGFPSGHALGSTMVWGGLALVLDRGTYRTRFGVAGAVVALVSLSRLVLGVHYLVDVVVGAALGVVVLGGLYRLADYGTDPGRVLFVAVAVGVAGLFGGFTVDSVAAVGGAVGGWLAWRGVAHAVPSRPTGGRDAAVGYGVLGLAGVLFGAVYVFELPLALTFLGTAVTVAAAVGAPVAGRRVGEKS